MKKLVYIFLFSFIFSAFFGQAAICEAKIQFNNIRIYNIENSKARVYWYTGYEPTRAVVYYGENAESLDKLINYGTYTNEHEVILGGLERDKTYYVKIVAYDQWGNFDESFINTFSTNEMKDTILPDFIEINILQVTRDAAVINWATNEDTRAEVFYGPDFNNLEGRADQGDMGRYHEAFLYGLSYDQKYYVRIEVIDRGENRKSRIISFKTSGAMSDKSSLQIYEIEPLNFDDRLVKAEEITLRWKTNFVAKSRIFYGTRSKEYDQQVEVSEGQHNLKHEIKLIELEPATTYYYKIEVYNSLYDKSLETRELSFTTTYMSQGRVLGTSTINLENSNDADNDGLSDNYEVMIGTNPFNHDSDGDGYADKHEIDYCYDPRIPGSTPDTKLKTAYYCKPILDSDYEWQKSEELRTIIDDTLGYQNISAKNWQVLSRAYVYGDYPAWAIVQAVKFGGKTVHPTIRFESWNKTAIYNYYINK